MKTREELNALRKGELADELNALSEQLGEPLSTGGTNAEMVERILAAQERVSQEQTGPEGDEAGQTESPVEPGPETPEPHEQGDGIACHVKAVSKNGFYRCGYFIPHQGVDLVLTDEQHTRMLSDASLLVE